jgi:ParB family chromosome partitioning protein
MVKRRNNIGGLLDKLNDKKTDSEHVEVVNTDAGNATQTRNPAIKLAMGTSEKRAKSVKEPILYLEHDQVIMFKYHDRHTSSLDTVKVQQIKRSITKEGQHFPGIVRKTDKVTADGRIIYELIVGRVRFEASRSVGVFKAFLRDLSDADATKVMLSENEDRQDITPYERWLSILPLVKDGILSNNEIAELIGWDKGNLSRSLKARVFYEEENMQDVLLDVTKVKLNQLIEVAALYEKDKSGVREAIAFIKENYPTRKDNLFLKAVIKRFSDALNPITKTLYLDGSKMTAKRVGDRISLNFAGLPDRSNIDEIINALEQIGAFK